MTILNSEDKEKIKRAIPKASNKIIDATAARLYIAYPDTNAWNYTGLSGAIVFSDDLVGHTFFLKMVDISGNRGVLWDQELYVDFQYNQDRLFFHTFELDECLAGLLFEDKKDAQHFYKRVSHREKYGSRQTLHNKKAIELKKKPSADADKRKVGLRGDLSQSIVENDGFSNEQRVRRARGVIYYDKEPPAEWRSFYKELEGVGIKEDMIAENREFIKDYISKHGGPLVGLEPPIPRKYMYKAAESDVVSRKSSVSSSIRRKKAPPPPPPPAAGAGTVSSSSASSVAKNAESSASSHHSHSASPDPFAAQNSAPISSPQKHFVPPLPASVHVTPQPALQQQQQQQSAPRPLPSRPVLPPGNAVPPILPTRAVHNAPPPPPSRNSIPQAPTQNFQQKTPRRSAAPPPPPPPRRTGPPPPPSRNASQKLSSPPPTTFPAVQQPQQQPREYFRPTAPIPATQPTPPTLSNATSGPSPPAPAIQSIPSAPPAPPIQSASAIPSAPPAPPIQSASAIPHAPPASAIPSAPPAPPAPPIQSASAIPPAPPASAIPTAPSAPSTPLPQADAGREALLASIRGAGIQSLKKTDKTHLEKPSPLLQKKGGSSAQVPPSAATPGQPGNLADALAAALKVRKDKVSQSDDEDDW